MKFISALGLDIGKKRIGVAGCDGTGLIATGLTTLQRGAFGADVVQLQAIAQTRRAQLLVVGLPYTLEGKLGQQALQTQKYAERLSTALQLPVEYMDERLTSVEAEEYLIGRRITPSRNRGLIDEAAARIILQRWLDQRRAIAAKQSAQAALEAIAEEI